MSDTEERHRDRRRYRSRSRSYSHETDNRRSNHHRVNRNNQGVRRKRHRSRSREVPQKRRSLSREHEGRWTSTRDDRDHNDFRRRGHSQSDNRRSRSPSLFMRSKGPLSSQKDAFQNDDLAIVKSEPTCEKQKPNFGNTGRLAAASNTIKTAGQSIVMKYHEPPEARKPPAKDRWRMYVFKDDEIVDTIQLAEQSCWLFGREAAVVDVLMEHSSSSKQHAVIQFRYMEKSNEFGDKKGKVNPYVLDLESANGTTVNDQAIPEAKYVELRDKDVVKFGHSSREYMVQLPSG